MTEGSGKSNGKTSPVLEPPANCVHGPETAEMSLAAPALFIAVIWSNALLTPPRQVCSVLMPTPWTYAFTLAADRAVFVTAS